MSFCGKCGTKIPDNTTVCPNCGVDGKPKTVPPPGGGKPSGKKEKKPAKKRGALLAIPILLVVLVAGAFCIWKFALPSGPAAVNVPEVAEDGSADPNIWKAYQIGMEQLMSDAAAYEEMGLGYCRDFCYDTALSGASSLQMTVCALLGDTSALACPDWYSASTITRAAPYPDFFQGLICEFKGDAAGAEAFYAQAELYYDFPKSLYAFRYLKDASTKDLEAVKADCEKLIASIRERHTNIPYALALSDVDFMAGYHQAMGDCYAQEGDLARTLQCYDMALRMNPFETENYISCAAVALEAQNDTAMTYLSQGLAFDPQDAGLNLLSALAFAGEGETEVARYYLDAARQDENITAEQKTMADALEQQLGGAAT